MKPDQTVWTALRRATHERHEAIEALLQLHHPLPRDRYERILGGFESFLRDWEPHLQAALPPELAAEAAARSRLPFLRHDLQVLGLPRREDRPCSLAARLPLPDLAAALGSQYVLEGSALGGQLVARQLAANLGLSPQSGAAYFHGWGEDTGRHWKQFRTRLDAHVPPEGPACDRACEAASRTFDLLIDTFTPLLHEPVAC